MTHLSTPSHPDTPSRPLSEEAISAGQYLQDLITQRPAVPFEALNEGFERYGAHVTHPTNQIYMLLMIMKDFRIIHSGIWKRVEHTLRLCHKAGWIQPASFLTQGGDVMRMEERYYGIWGDIGHDPSLEPLEDYMRTFAHHTPSRLEELGEILSLFLTLLPPPRGVKTHIESALRAFDLPLAHSLRLGLKHQTLPLFSEQAFRDHLMTGLFSGRLRFADSCVEPLGQMLFQEVHAWTENFSPSFFEDVLQQFMTSDYISLREGHLRKLSQEEKKIGHALMRCAQRLHTASLLTQDMAPASTHCSPRQRL